MPTRTLVVFVLIGFCVPSLGYTHGGGLDRCASHHDRKRGGYHVHRMWMYCTATPRNKPVRNAERRHRRMTQQSLASWLCLSLLCGTPAAADTLAGRVVAVADGDTITVLDAAKVQHKIRLMAIDAPEKKQPFGNRSKQHLSYLVFSKPVTVDYTKLDRYGRIVGKVMVSSPDACPDAAPECPTTLDAGLAQITVGLAWHYKQYATEQTEVDRARYAFAEEEARERQVGIWRDLAPIPPWSFRRGEKE